MTNDGKALPLKVLNKPVQIKVVTHWCDQLLGEKMAKMHLRLIRDGKVIKDHDLFGIFERGDDEKYIHWAEMRENDEIVSMAEVGDEY